MHHSDQNLSGKSLSLLGKDPSDIWDEEEEIELEPEEHELFLKDEYIESSSNDVLPIKVSQQNEFRSRTPNILTQGSRIDSNFSKLTDREANIKKQKDNLRKSNIEQFQVDDSGRGSPVPSSVIYQMPNYEQFAGNLAPSSPSSVLISFVIIFVILAVTIVPKIVPQSSSSGYDQEDMFEDYDYYDTSISLQVEVENKTVKPDTKVNNVTPAQQRDHQKPLHSDFRCKCICPPFPSSNETQLSSAIQLNQRRLYVGNTAPTQCNCLNIVKAHYKPNMKMRFRDFCHHCECKYQSRNTTTIMRNVVFFIAVLTGLVLYMMIQYLLRHFRITRRSLPQNMRWLHHQVSNDTY